MRIAIINDIQPSVNPRTVKEADALSEDGHNVRVVSVSRSRETDSFDEDLVVNRRWRYEVVNYKRDNLRATSRWAISAIRSRVYEQVARLTTGGGVAEKALCRFYGGLLKKVMEETADMYIAHNLTSLPVAAAAAEVTGALLGFDIEDYHADEDSPGKSDPVRGRVKVYLMEKYLPRCDYLSATSERMADVVVDRFGVRRPVVLYNAFPLASAAGIAPPEQRVAPDTPVSARCQVADNNGGKPVVGAGSQAGSVRYPADRSQAGSVRYPADRSQAGSVRYPADRSQAGSVRYPAYWFSQAIGLDRGLQDFIRALPRLSRKVDLHLRGKIDADVKRELVALGTSLGVGDQLFFHGLIHADDLVRDASQFDFGLALEQPINQNREITVTNKLFTYLLAGIVPVATDTPGQLEVMGQVSGCGVIYRAGDIDQLAERMNELLADPELILQSKIKAWEAARNRFCWDIEKRKLVEAIRQIETQRPSRTANAVASVV